MVSRALAIALALPLSKYCAQPCRKARTPSTTPIAARPACPGTEVCGNPGSSPRRKRPRAQRADRRPAGGNRLYRAGGFRADRPFVPPLYQPRAGHAARSAKGARPVGAVPESVNSASGNCCLPARTQADIRPVKTGPASDREIALKKASCARTCEG